MTLLHQALRAGQAGPMAAQASARQAVVVGGAGALGAAVLEQVLGSGAFTTVQVAVDRPLDCALRGLQPLLLDWAAPPQGAHTAVLVFDQARGRHGREAAFVMPQPAQLPALARWLHAGGVRHLVVLLPHAPGLLPAALNAGLATLDEQALAAQGFEQLVLVRPARAGPLATGLSGLAALGQAMLAQLHWMVPQREQPLRAAKVAQFVAALLAELSAEGSAGVSARQPAPTPGVRVAPAELLWQFAQAAEPAALLQAWLRGQALPPARAPRQRW